MMSTLPEVRAELSRLVDYANTELDDEHSDRQYVLERVTEDLARLVEEMG